MRGLTGPGPGPLRGPVVPAYFHPCLAPGAWAGLARAAGRLRLVVLNVADGPGAAPDPAFAATAARLRAAGVPLAGYVDTAYGARPAAEVARDVRRFRDWYGVAGVFLDQVSAGSRDLPHYRAVVAAARRGGAGPVVLNHGVYPVPGYAALADLLVTFEGPWSAYRRLSVPAWAYRWPARQFTHLVYATPRRCLMAALRHADERNVGGVYLTDHAGSNPWRRLPSYFAWSMAAVRAAEPRGPTMRGRTRRP